MRHISTNGNLLRHTDEALILTITLEELLSDYKMGGDCILS